MARTKPDFARKPARRLRHEIYSAERISFAFETTTACNLKCGFCHHTRAGRKSATIPLDEFTDIVEGCARLAAKSGRLKIAVSPSATGEFFSTPEPAMYLNVIREFFPSAKVGAASNFTRFSDSVIEGILAENLLDNLTCSMNYFDPELYREICGGNLEAVFKSLDSFSNIRKSLSSKMVVEIALKTHSDINSAAAKTFEKTARERWSDSIKISWNAVSCWGGHVDLSPYADAGKPMEFPCFGLSFPVFLIKAGGDAYPCCCCATIECDEQLRLGNILSDNPTKLLAAYEKIKSRHLEGKWKSYTLCSKCNIFTQPEHDVYFRIGKRYF